MTLMSNVNYYCLDWYTCNHNNFTTLSFGAGCNGAAPTSSKWPEKLHSSCIFQRLFEGLPTAAACTVGMEGRDAVDSCRRKDEGTAHLATS